MAGTSSSASHELDPFKIAGASISGWYPSAKTPGGRLEAARPLAALKDGAFWIGTDENLSRRRQHNLVFLHARRLEFPACAEITDHIAELWRSAELPVTEIMARLGRRWSPAEVEAAAWKLVADAAAQGRSPYLQDWAEGSSSTEDKPDDGCVRWN